MERLTYRGRNGKPYVKADGYYHHCRMNLDIIADKLAAYEDADEQGLLLRLPCKLGDTCYEIIHLGNDARKIVEHPLNKADLPYLDKIYGTYKEVEAALEKE